jgi:hypothetical protein
MQTIPAIYPVSPPQYSNAYADDFPYNLHISRHISTAEACTDRDSRRLQAGVASTSCKRGQVADPSCMIDQPDVLSFSFVPDMHPFAKAEVPTYLRDTLSAVPQTRSGSPAMCVCAMATARGDHSLTLYTGPSHCVRCPLSRSRSCSRRVSTDTSQRYVCDTWLERVPQSSREQCIGVNCAHKYAPKSTNRPFIQLR